MEVTTFQKKVTVDESGLVTEKVTAVTFSERLLRTITSLDAWDIVTTNSGSVTIADNGSVTKNVTSVTFTECHDRGIFCHDTIISYCHVF